MPDRPSLTATRRTVTGKKVAFLRRDGQLPGVVYGHGTPSENVSLDAHQFDLFRRHSGASTLVDLRVDDGRARPVLVYDVQFHPVTRRALHVDLFAVRMTEEITVDVRLSAQGTAPAVENAGGTLIHNIESVRIRALPANLPQSIDYDVSPLVDFDAAIHVRDLSIPSDVTLVTDVDEIVARVLAPRIEIEPEPVAPEGEEAAEAAAAEGAEGAERGEASTEEAAAES